MAATKEKGDAKQGPGHEAPKGAGEGKGVTPGAPCRYFLSGTCNWGERCAMLHPGVPTKGAPWGAELQRRA